jgi:hypothetical protein
LIHQERRQQCLRLDARRRTRDIGGGQLIREFCADPAAFVETMTAE